MPLPAAVAEKARAANELIVRASAASAAPGPAAAASTPAGDVATLQRQLADANEALRKATERANSADGIARANGTELRAAKEAATKAQERVKQLEQGLTAKIENQTITSLTDAERKNAGEDLVQMAGKVAREVVDAVLTARLGPIQENVDLLNRMGEAAYWAAIDAGVPNFAVVNDDPKFIAWLNQPDPATGRLRMDRIKRAEAGRQGHLVVEIFRAFMEGREIGASAPSAPAPTPVVDPGAGGGNSVDVELDGSGKRTWTRAQIKAHYDEKTQGVWRGKEDEWRKLELDINAAYREKRIKG